MPLIMLGISFVWFPMDSSDPWPKTKRLDRIEPVSRLNILRQTSKLRRREDLGQ